MQALTADSDWAGQTGMTVDRLSWPGRSRSVIRRVATLVFAIAMVGAEPKAHTQNQVGSVSLDCQDVYPDRGPLPDATAALLALQRKCELAVQHNNRPHMEYEQAESKLALLRIHIALHSVTRSDWALPNTIDPFFAGAAAAILASIYKGKDAARYEAAIISAARLAAAGDELHPEPSDAAIREAILIYVARGDYASAGMLIGHLEMPVLSNQTENGKFLISLLQSREAPKVRNAIASLARSWGSDHVEILGPIDYAIAETYKSEDSAKYLQWLNVAERNDFNQASAELNRLFFDFSDYHRLIGALRALGYDDGFTVAGDDVDQVVLVKNVAAFGAAALGSGLDDVYSLLSQINR